jgi:hypothetical protein
MTAAMKRKKVDAKTSNEELLKRYEEIFENITCFTDSIEKSDVEIQSATAKVEEAKCQFETAKAELSLLLSAQDANRIALFRYLHPKSGEIMPLFDRMEEADETIHGINSDEWRRESLGALKLSMPSVKALTDFDIVLVGQLQDLVLADAQSWWEKVPGLTAGSSAAIVDRLNDFIFDRTTKK